MATAGKRPRSAQAALDKFVTAQLLDNGMDSLAEKINALRAKLLQLQAAHPHGELDAKKKLARRLQHWLATACRLLAKQRTQIEECIETLEQDVSSGLIGKGDASPEENTYSRTYTRPGSGSESASASNASSAVLTSPQSADILPRGRLVSAKVARSHELWILARVIRYDGASSTYEVEDVDSGDDSDGGGPAVRRHHFVPWNQVVSLPAGTLPEGEWIQYAVDERVMAMYPNTTSFYRSTIRVPNPKVGRRRCRAWFELAY